jgi:hypothetical protein
MNHAALWCVEVVMHRPEVALAPLLLVLGVWVLRGAGGGRGPTHKR